MRLIHPFKHRFHIDYETRSKEDIMSVGRHKYFGDQDFKILMMSYAMDDEPVKLYECYDRQLPRWFVKDILPDPTILKTAYEAPFEIGATEHELGIRVDRRQWECAKIMAAMAGYPMSLSETAKAMKLETLKDTRGKALIKLFTQPALPRDRKRNGDNFWNYPEYFPTEWIEFCEYCVQDTVVERAIVHHPAVEDMPDMPLAEREYWLLDQRINERGVRVDIGLVKKVIEMHDTHIEKLVNEGTKLTGLENINSRDQVKAWLNSNGCILANMKKDTIMETLGHPGLSGRVKRVLQIRQETSKSSMTKYDAMVNCCYRLDRVYGMVQHYGANRTGRACLAEGTMVLIKNETGIYEKPIEEVLLSDLVFDGDEWVKHSGVVFSGEKEVIFWDDVCATEDHIVYLDSSTSTTLKNAKWQSLKLWTGNTPYIKSQVPLDDLTSD